MKIIKLFPVNICMPVTKFPRLTILLFCKRRSSKIFGQFRGFFKETNYKNWLSFIEKERESKIQMVKILCYLQSEKICVVVLQN